ncbi:Acid phosphatase 1 [Senna tora]|uniref:Acid phosphatase 1 n=1 Tax=Senna tora TaxID=362788 RepID=A0A834WN37_9FABA|nr:Acid phosphatase 1 [Senna tora]
MLVQGRHEVLTLKQEDSNCSSSLSEEEYGRRWRLAAEANNVDPWRTVPGGCYEHVRNYMIGGESGEYKGKSAGKYKSEKRKEIEGEGYRIWGNVGDQWSDLQGYSLGNRTFKLPNPMYFIP